MSVTRIEAGLGHASDGIAEAREGAAAVRRLLEAAQTALAAALDGAAPVNPAAPAADIRNRPPVRAATYEGRKMERILRGAADAALIILAITGVIALGVWASRPTTPPAVVYAPPPAAPTPAPAPAPAPAPTQGAACPLPGTVYVAAVGGCVEHVTDPVRIGAATQADTADDPQCRGKPVGYRYPTKVVGPDGRRGVAHHVCGTRP